MRKIEVKPNKNGDSRAADHVTTIVEFNEGCPEGHSESNWVPWSEQPPEKEGRYLITVDEDGRKYVSDDFFYFRGDGTPSWYLSQNVKAWKPLPDPY